jgi:uncharacterized GH25 family protein
MKPGDVHTGHPRSLKDRHVPAQAFGHIEGLVVDDAGQPAPEVTVMIKTSNQPHPDIAVVTDENGSFGFDGLVPGRYVVAAFRAGGQMAEAEVTVRPGQVNPMRIRID